MPQMFKPTYRGRPARALQTQPAIAAPTETARSSTRGAIFTRPEVAEFILDLVGYTPDLPLHQKRILEPSFGDGVFLMAILRRLLLAAKRAGSADLTYAIRAVELHQETFEATQKAVTRLLQQEGFSPLLAEHWLIPGDYLLSSLEGPFDYVVGNPPYVRMEAIPVPLLAEYKRRYPTMYDRADLYIPFIERSLLLLAAGGRLGFICADRWIKNRSGARLRKLVAEHFHLKIYVDMTDAPAFRSAVAAYPAIVVIGREAPGPTRVVQRPPLEESDLTRLAGVLQAPTLPTGCGVQVAQVTHSAKPWLLIPPAQRALLERLEQSFPSLEEVGCKVGIGVATGADPVFIGEFATLEVEPDRKLPLATTQDLRSGEVQWHGKGVINPFHEDGSLVDLQAYPRLRTYLEAHKDRLARRHCARRSSDHWYRTIDRIVPALARTPKLLVPDIAEIAGQVQVVLEEGKLYPHHNLYYLTSTSWDLRALQAVLLSEIGRLFIAAYSTRMRGGYLRFQAQYLRRIHIPHWANVPQALRLALAEAAQRRDLEACNWAVLRLYGLSYDPKTTP